MSKQKITKMLKEWLEDIESGHLDEMDLPDLDLYKADEEKSAFIAGMKMTIESILNNI